jgi:hypothetical protein
MELEELAEAPAEETLCLAEDDRADPAPGWVDAYEQ